MHAAYNKVVKQYSNLEKKLGTTTNRLNQAVKHAGEWETKAQNAKKDLGEAKRACEDLKKTYKEKERNSEEKLLEALASAKESREQCLELQKRLDAAEAAQQNLQPTPGVQRVQNSDNDMSPPLARNRVTRSSTAAGGTVVEHDLAVDAARTRHPNTRVRPPPLALNGNTSASSNSSAHPNAAPEVQRDGNAGDMPVVDNVPPGYTGQTYQGSVHHGNNSNNYYPPHSPWPYLVAHPPPSVYPTPYIHHHYTPSPAPYDHLNFFPYVPQSLQNQEMTPTVTSSFPPYATAVVDHDPAMQTVNRDLARYHFHPRAAAPPPTQATVQQAQHALLGRSYPSASGQVNPYPPSGPLLPRGPYPPRGPA